jgi:hypothetical protein
LKYIRQTGRTFNIRPKDHIHIITNNNSNSAGSNHIISTGCAYGTITDTVDVIRTGRERKYLNTLEKYYIYEISRDNLHTNNTHRLIFRHYMNYMSNSNKTPQ